MLMELKSSDEIKDGKEEQVKKSLSKEREKRMFI